MWTLVKRADTESSKWYLVFSRAGVRERISLGTASLPQAKMQARVEIDKWLAAQRRAPAPPAVATMAQVFLALSMLAIRASVKGREQYVWGMRWVLKRALRLADDASVDALSSRVLTAETARAFFVSILTEANEMPSHAAQNKFKRSALQIFGFAKALLATAALESMRLDCGLVLPDVSGFRAGSKVGLAMLNPGDASEWSAPDDAVLRRTLVEWVKLGRTPGYIVPPPPGRRVKGYAGKPLPEWLRRNMFIAIGLEISCGLRKSEAKKVRWDWFQRRDGHSQLHEGDVKVKNNSNRISVRPVDPYWRILNSVCDRNGWRGQPGDACLSQRPQTRGDYRALEFSHGGHSDADYWPFVHVGYWMRWLGWNTQKTNHALRDWTASLITMRFGLERASRWCRHKQLATTQAHYGRMVNDDDMDNPRRLAWFRWAK